MKRNRLFAKSLGAVLLSVVLLTGSVPAFAARAGTDSSDFIRGVDVSMLKEEEKLGAVYYDGGICKDAMRILRDHGANYVRLRLWVNPYDKWGNSYGGGDNDFSTDLALAKRANSLGMKILLDFHFSDFWVDPGKQIKPKAWANLSYADLKTTLYRYVKTTMNEFVSNGIRPDMVQVGNEISSGFLWKEGKVGNGNNNFTELAQLLQKAIRGVRDSRDPSAKIILHLDNGGNDSLYQWWFRSLQNTGINLDYNIIGLSYYPMWQGTLDQLQYNIDDISKQFNKDVLVAETAYGWTTKDGDGLGNSFGASDAKKVGYPASPEGQIQFINDLKTTLLNVPGRRGLGFFYWEPDWIPVRGANWATRAGASYIGANGVLNNPWDNLTLFDFGGRALPSVNILNAPGDNLVKNPGFEWNGYTNAPSGWSVWQSNGTPAGTIKTESEYAFDGNYNLTFWNPSAYSCLVYQDIKNLPNGTYTLCAWVKSGGGQAKCQIYSKNYGGRELDAAVPFSDTAWKKIQIKNIRVTSGTCEVGLYAAANAGDWCSIDNVSFRRVVA